VQGDDPKFDLQAFALAAQKSIPTIQHVISVRAQQSREGILRFEELVAPENAAAAAAAIGAIPRDPFQVGVFQLSGRTTSVPKVIPRMQNDYLLNARLTADFLGYEPADVMFMPMPMIHNACMICFWLPTLLSGAAFAIAADLSPQAWLRTFKEARPNWI